MRDSQSFFDLPSEPAFAFTEAPADVRVTGEAGRLTFPTAYATPHVENNTVHARWFPAAGEAPVGARTTSRGRAVVVLPQWNSDAGGHIGLVADCWLASASRRFV